MINDPWKSITSQLVDQNILSPIEKKFDYSLQIQQINQIEIIDTNNNNNTKNTMNESMELIGSSIDPSEILIDLDSDSYNEEFEEINQEKNNSLR